MHLITIEPDNDLENPLTAEDWRLVSFHQNHSAFARPDTVGLDFSGLGRLERTRRYTMADLMPAVKDKKLQQKFRHGLAFWLSFYDHSGTCWWRMGEQGPLLAEFRWDGSWIAGFMFYEKRADMLPIKTYEKRGEWVDNLLKTYNLWSNGFCYQYMIEDGDGELIDACSGFYDIDSMAAQITEGIGTNTYRLLGPAAHVLRDRDLRKPPPNGAPHETSSTQAA